MLKLAVEALIGSAYLHGGPDAAISCLQIFGLGMDWTPIPLMIKTIINRAPVGQRMPFDTKLLESMIGYEFRMKILMIEALTHGSYMVDAQTVSYERLEFVGDAVLDMIVVDYLYRADGKQYSPGQMQLIKAAVVNEHFLGYVCLRTQSTTTTFLPKADRHGSISHIQSSQNMFLWQFLLHSSQEILSEGSRIVKRYQSERSAIEDALMSDHVFPFAALVGLDIPKVFSDVIESLLGAVYLDSGGSMMRAISVLETLGIMSVLRRIVSDDVDVTHPVSQLYIWASKNSQTLEFVETKVDGRLKMVVVLNGKELLAEEVERGQSRKSQLKAVVAEKAIRQLRLREQTTLSGIVQ